jgi:hypothetical protein
MQHIADFGKIRISGASKSQNIDHLFHLHQNGSVCADHSLPEEVELASGTHPEASS